MRKAIAILVLSFATGVFVSPYPCEAQAPPVVANIHIHNFHQVDSSLYRGAQPGVQDLKLLKALGIKTIVNLRGHDDKEEREARALGMQYVDVPMSPLGRPTQSAVNRTLELITSAASQPVFVHCQHGSDRTGTVVAIYRIKHDGWTAQKAIKEAVGYGMKFWEIGMKDYIRDYEENLSRSAN